MTHTLKTWFGKLRAVLILLALPRQTHARCNNGFINIYWKLYKSVQFFHLPVSLEFMSWKRPLFQLHFISQYIDYILSFDPSLILQPIQPPVMFNEDDRYWHITSFHAGPHWWHVDNREWGPSSAISIDTEMSIICDSWAFYINLYNTWYLMLANILAPGMKILTISPRNIRY